MPITVARFTQWDITVGIVIAQRMLLTTIDIFRPIAAVGILIVQQAADAKLLRGGAIPAGPIACARCLMAEDAVQPVAMFCR